MLVHVVADHQHIVGNAEVADLLDFLHGEDFAERVVWVVEDDGLGAGREHLLQLILI